MDTASHVFKPEARVKLTKPTPMIMVKGKHVLDAGLPVLMVATRKAFFFNRRAANLSALGRRGTKSDIDVDFDVANMFSTFESDTILAVGRKGEVSFIEFKVNAEGAGELTKVTGSVSAEIVAAAFIAGSSDAVALLADGTIVRISSDLKTTTVIRKETACKGKFIATHGDYILAPAKDGIDIVSLSTKVSSLTKAWVPHTGSEPIIAVHVFRHWKPTNGGLGVVMTVGAGGREVRLWTGLGNNSLELAAHLTLEIPKEIVDEKRIAVADREENVLVCFGNSVIVLTTDEHRIKFSRATEFEHDVAIGPCAAYNETTKSGQFQLVFTTRDGDSVNSVRLPPSIIGAPNLVSDGAAAPADAANTASRDREANYFAAARAKDTSSAVVISSSLAPAGVVDGAAAQKAAAASIAAVTADLVRKVSDVSVSVAGTQKDLSSLVGALQSPATQSTAARLGKEFATRNANRFNNNVAAPAAASAASGSASEGDKKNVEQLELICTFIKGAVTSAVTARSDTVVNPKVKTAVESIGSEADMTDVPLPKLTSVLAMQSFNANIDKALKVQNEYLKQEADTRASTYNAQVVRSGATTRQSIAESRRFMADLKAELAGLTKDIEAVKVELSTVNDRNTIGAVSSENVVEECVALVAEKKDYETAVTKITQARNVQLLLEFLGNPHVKAAFENNAFAPGSISAPAFGMLINQLAGNIEISKGQIAPRVSAIYTLCMDWDDHIDEAFEEGSTNEKARNLLNTIAPSIAAARQSLESLPKEDVSIESRRQARTSARVLAKFE